MSKGIRKMAPHDVGTRGKKTILTGEGNQKRLKNSKYKRNCIKKTNQPISQNYIIIGNGQRFQVSFRINYLMFANILVFNDLF